MKVSKHIDYTQKPKHYHKIVAGLLNKYIDKKDGRILDVGCGVGHTLAEIRKFLPQARLVATDIDKKCLEVTEKRINIDGKFLIRKIEDIAGSNNYGKFDAIIMSHVLEHLLRPADVIVEMMKMLRLNGIMILAVPNPVRPDVFLAAIRKKNYVNKGHAYAWDRSHWMNFLENILFSSILDK